MCIKTEIYLYEANLQKSFPAAFQGFSSLSKPENDLMDSKCTS